MISCMHYFIRNIFFRLNIPCLLLLWATSIYGQSYSLDSCKKKALENNAKIKNASLEIQIAEQTKKAAFTKYFPNINLMGNAFKSNNNFFDMDLNSSDLSIRFENAALNDIWQTLYHNYAPYLPNMNIQTLDHGILGGITAIQPVFAGGRIVIGNKLAKLGIEAAKYQADLSEKEVLLKTEESYWLVISLEEKMKTINTVSELLDTLNKDVTNAYLSGVTTENDLLKVKLKQNEIRSNKIKIKNGLILSKMALCQYIGITYNDSLVLIDTISLADTIQSPWQYRSNHQETLSHRTEFKLLDLNVKAENLKKKMIIGETLPQIGVGAGYVYNNLLGKDKTNGILFATVSVPISGWWEAAHNIKKQKLQVEIAKNNQQNLNESMTLQMQQAWNETEESYNQVLLAQETIDETMLNYTYNMQHYQAGVKTLSEVLESQSLLQQSRDQFSDYYITYKIKLLRYLQMVQ